MSMSENRRRELLGMSEVGREVLAETGQVAFEQPPTSNLTPAQKQALGVLQGKLDEAREGLGRLQQANFEESQRRAADPDKVNAALALSPLGQQIIAEQRMKAIAEAQRADANQVRPTDKYLGMTGLGQQSLSYRKSGGKS